jgi:hypothetical protein
MSNDAHNFSRPVSSLDDAELIVPVPAPRPPQAADLLPSPDKGTQMDAGRPLFLIALVILAILVYGAFAK